MHYLTQKAIKHLVFNKIFLYAKDPCKAKYQLLISKQKGVGLNHYDDPQACIEYSYDMDDIYKNIEEYDLNKKYEILIAFDDMIANLLSNKDFKR